MSESKCQAYMEMYQKLNTKEGENDVYRIVKWRVCQVQIKIYPKVHLKCWVYKWINLIIIV
jgi:hypothetical protein